MAVSDELSKLAARATEAEDRVRAAGKKAKDGLEEDLDFTRSAVEKQNKVLHELVSEEKGRISDHWSDLEAAWNGIVTKVREDVESRKAQHDRHEAERKADWAEDDARVAINFAYSAIVEAEYAALDASLARMEADAMSKEAGATA